MHVRRSRDRRVGKTQASLLDAVGALIHEKSWDTIGVKEILDRANVGRTTFYAHFRDKDELLDHAIDDVLRPSETARAPIARSARVLRFALPLLEHIDRQHMTIPAPQAMKVVHRHLRQRIERFVASEIREATRGRRVSIAPDLLVRFVTASFDAFVEWWGFQGAGRPSAKDADAMFRALVTPALSEALD